MRKIREHFCSVVPVDVKWISVVAAKMKDGVDTHGCIRELRDASIYALIVQNLAAQDTNLRDGAVRDKTFECPHYCGLKPYTYANCIYTSGINPSAASSCPFRREGFYYGKHSHYKDHAHHSESKRSAKD